MTGDEVQARLAKLGKDRRWLSEATGYEWVSLRDCLAPGSKKGISLRMSEKIQTALSEAESKEPPGPGDLLGEFTAGERKQIAEAASRDGYPGPHAWIIATVRWVLSRPIKKRK